jgi:hypothetical protein
MWWLLIVFLVVVLLVSFVTWVMDRERDEGLRIQRDVESWKKLRSIR